MKSLPLGKLVSHIKGKPPSKKKNIVSLVSLLSPDYLRGKSLAEMVPFSSNLIMVENGELLLLWDGSNAGEVFQSKNGILASTMVKFDIIHDSIEKPYLYFALKNYEGYLKAQTNGSGIPHVDPEILYNLEINIFSKIERQQIAKILSTVDKAIEQTETLIAKHEKIKTGLMQDLLTKGIDENGKIRSEETHEFKDSPLGRIPVEWEVMELGKCCEILVSNVDKKIINGEEKVRLCNYMDVYENDYISEAIDFMFATASKSEIIKFKLNIEDVIITKDSEDPDDIAVPTVVVDDIPNLVCGYHLAIYRPMKSLLNGIFLSKALQLSSVNKFFSVMANGVTRFGLVLESLNKNVIPGPSLSEQEKIVELLIQLDKRVNSDMDELDKYKKIKTGLMQDLLTGKVRVSKLLKN